MTKMKSALGPASPKRASEVSFCTSTFNAAIKKPQRQNLQAAVVSHDDPEARNVARVVPEDARVVRMQNVVLGYYKPNGSRFVFRSRQARAIEALYLCRYDVAHGEVPFPDEEIAFAMALVAHAAPEEARAALVRWSIELRPEIEHILADPVARARRWKATELGELLKLTVKEREFLGIDTIRAVGQSLDDLKEARKAKDRERKRAKRAAQACGRVRPISMEKLEPWTAAGMSKSAWYAAGWRRRNIAAWTTYVRSKEKKELGADKNCLEGARSARTAILSTLNEPRTIREISEMTGLPSGTVSPWLSRLRGKGLIEQVRRGVWVVTAARSAPQRAGDVPNVRTATAVEARKQAPHRTNPSGADKTRKGKCPTKVATAFMAAPSKGARSRGAQHEGRTQYIDLSRSASRHGLDVGRGPAPSLEALEARDVPR